MASRRQQPSPYDPNAPFMSDEVIARMEALRLGSQQVPSRTGVLTASRVDNPPARWSAPPAGPSLPPRPRPPQAYGSNPGYGSPLSRPPPVPMPEPRVFGSGVAIAVPPPSRSDPSPISPTYGLAPSPSTYPANTSADGHRPRHSVAADTRPHPPTATPPRRSRATSGPPAPAANLTPTKDGGVQCSGITKAGKRCTRIVKSPHPLTLATVAQDGDLERYCHQHTKDILIPSGYYSKTRGTWVTFDDWIPSHLSDEVKAALRVEMEKAPSIKDEPGYIYAYQIRDPKAPEEVQIKVGRAVKLAKRLDEWAKQCGSKEVILRGWWSGRVVDDQGGGPSLLRGRIEPGLPGGYCHRLERLVHLELSDIVINDLHLALDFLVTRDPARRTTSPPPPRPTPQRPSRPSNASKPLKSVAKKCPDCGKVHKEIFALTRVRAGPLRGREWEEVVRPVIERWGKFIERTV